MCLLYSFSSANDLSLNVLSVFIFIFGECEKSFQFVLLNNDVCAS